MPTRDAAAMLALLCDDVAEQNRRDLVIELELAASGGPTGDTASRPARIEMLTWQRDEQQLAARRWPEVFTADVVGHHPRRRAEGLRYSRVLRQLPARPPRQDPASGWHVEQHDDGASPEPPPPGTTTPAPSSRGSVAGGPWVAGRCPPAGHGGRHRSTLPTSMTSSWCVRGGRAHRAVPQRRQRGRARRAAPTARVVSIHTND